MQDRKDAYASNLVGLMISWSSRINDCARIAYVGDGTEQAVDAAKEAVETMLFNSLKWENVSATDISDVAYDAATMVEREQYQS